jgi:CopG family nickel-responsive transcriptional regulator
MKTEKKAPHAISRFGVSIDKTILEKFDALVKANAYPTRSKAIENLINNFLSDALLADSTASAVGSINIIYDHHRRELPSKLTSIQHDFEDIIISSHHLHLNHHNCFETVIVKGAQNKINTLLKKVKSVKGIKYASLNIFSESSI